MFRRDIFGRNVFRRTLALVILVLSIISLSTCGGANYVSEINDTSTDVPISVDEAPEATLTPTISVLAGFTELPNIGGPDGDSSVLLFDSLADLIPTDEAGAMDGSAVEVTKDNNRFTITLALDRERLGDYDSQDIYEAYNRLGDVLGDGPFEPMECPCPRPTAQFGVTDDDELTLQFGSSVDSGVSSDQSEKDYGLNVLQDYPVIVYDEDRNVFLTTGPISLDLNGEALLNRNHPIFEDVSDETLDQMQQDIDNDIPIDQLLDGCEECKQRDPETPAGCPVTCTTTITPTLTTEP
jgi:hypothetical protein